MHSVEREPEAIRYDRARKASYTVITSYLATGASLLVSLISIPLALNYLDAERYGLWLTIGSIIAYLNVTDLGLGQGLQNRIAEARGRGDIEQIGYLLSTAFSTMVFVGLLPVGIGVAASWLAPIGEWLHVSSTQVELELRWTLTVTVLTLAYLLPTRMIANAQNGFQEAYFGWMWSIVGSAMSLLALILVIGTRGSMVALALAIFTLRGLVDVPNFWHFFARHEEARLSWRKIDLKLLPDLFTIGWQFFLLQLYTLILWQTDNLVIVARMGGESVVPYAVAFRLIWLPLGLLGSIPSSLWPAYTEAKARDDWNWIRSTYRRTTVTTMLFAGAIAVALVIWGQEIIHLWAGPKAQGSFGMMAGLCLYIILGHWTNCNAMMVNAISRPIHQVFSGLFDAALNLGFSLYLIRIWGLTGVAWGTTLANLLVSSWFLAWSVWAMTEKRISPPWRETLRLMLVPVGISFLVGLSLSRILPLEWHPLSRIAVGVGGTTIAYAASAYLFATIHWRATLKELIIQAAGRLAGQVWRTTMQKGAFRK